jgi:hypothetical protein
LILKGSTISTEAEIKEKRRRTKKKEKKED